jgi:hypothetical protein
MSSKKNKKNQTVVEEPVDDTVDLDELTEAEIAEEDSPRLSREDAKKLFETYREVNAEIVAAEAMIVSLTTQRSNVVKAIYEGVGKGPFKFDGATVTVMTRTSKEEGSETAYFFKRLGAAIVDMDA